jgi:hypothetical protein
MSLAPCVRRSASTENGSKTTADIVTRTAETMRASHVITIDVASRFVMTIMEPMNSAEHDDLFDPDLALLASEADWDVYLDDIESEREEEESK